MPTHTETVAYAYGKAETWLETYAKQNQLNAAQFIMDVLKFGLGLSDESEIQPEPGPIETPVKAETKTGRGHFRVLRKLPCKVCGEPVLNKNMGNHIRYTHGGKAGKSAKSTGGAAYWARFTPVERSAEMRRRQSVAKRKRRKAAKANSNLIPMGGVA